MKVCYYNFVWNAERGSTTCQSFPSPPPLPLLLLTVLIIPLSLSLSSCFPIFLQPSSIGNDWRECVWRFLLFVHPVPSCRLRNNPKVLFSPRPNFWFESLTTFCLVDTINQSPWYRVLFASDYVKHEQATPELYEAIFFNVCIGSFSLIFDVRVCQVHVGASLCRVY